MQYSIDSRTIKPGQYFIPVKGKHFHGQDFIKDAVNKGGILLDVDLHQYTKKYRKKLKAKVIAITGSCGKSTLKEMLLALFSPYFNTVATKANQNNEIGLPLSLLHADFQTDIIILELGIRKPGDMKFLTQICRPDIAIITHISLSHMAFFSSLKHYASEKAAIFQKPLHWQSTSRNAYICEQSKYFELLQKKALNSGFNCESYSGKDYQEAHLNLCYKLGRSFQLSDEQISTALKDVKPLPQRLTRIQLSRFTLIDDSYNANPDSVIYALKHIQRYPNRRLFVLGKMAELGQFEKEAYESIYEHLQEAALSIFITFGPPIPPPVSSIPHIHFETRKELHRFLACEIRHNDVVLVKGSRNMEMEKTIAYLKTYV